MASRSPAPRPRAASASAIRSARASMSRNVNSWQAHSRATSPARSRNVGAKSAGRIMGLQTTDLYPDQSERPCTCDCVSGKTRLGIGTKVAHADLGKHIGEVGGAGETAPVAQNAREDPRPLAIPAPAVDAA